MIFDKLANVITRRYKLIIVVWIIALLVAIPAMLNVSNAVQYDTDMSGGAANESTQVDQLVKENFQGSVANSTLIIVLQTYNMTAAQSQAFVMELQQRLGASTDITYLERTTSIYSYSDTILQMAIMQLGPEMRPAEAQVNQSAFLLWGIPALHVQNWAGNTSDSEAYNLTVAQLQVYLNGQDANTSAMAMGYYQAFAAAWNGTASDPFAE